MSQDLNGFLHIKSMLSTSLVESLSTALDRRERAESPGPMLQGPDAEPFRELLVHPAIVPALNTILGAGFRLASGPSLGSEDKTEFHGGAVERSHGGNYEGYFWRGGRMFSGRVVVEVSNRLVSVLPATKVSCWPQFVLRDEGEADGGLVSNFGFSLGLPTEMIRPAVPGTGGCARQSQIEPGGAVHL